MTRNDTPNAGRDVGAMLPMVMALMVFSSMVVIALASYVTADLRYANVVEDRADRLAAADGGLRFGVERLRNFQTLCTTGAGTGGGFTTIFPPEINGAVTTVTCRRVGSTISDIQGWGVVVTGAGVPVGQSLFRTQGAGGSGGSVKTFSGPVYVADPTRIDLNSDMKIENGDLWYTSTNCANPPAIDALQSGDLTFSPAFFRGPLCTDLTWNGGLFTAPSGGTPPTSTVNPAPSDADPSCRVFSPGKYTVTPDLAADNYFLAGDYYLENVTIDLHNKSLIAGFPGGAGDGQKIADSPCQTRMQIDRATATAAGQRGGATFYLGGTSRFKVRSGGELEIFRRLQTEAYLSVFALPSAGTGYVASTVGYGSDVLETEAGNNNDVAVHGLIWAPYARLTMGNITNAATGQLLGGVVVAILDTQASASADAFAIGIETNPVAMTLLLTSEAEKDGRSTSIRAVVQYRPDSGELAVNSWRVID